MRSALSAILILPLLLSACRDTGLQGTMTDNQAPKTYLTVDAVNRPEDQRLPSSVHITWWGDDPDGFVVRYEYALGDTLGATWLSTTRTDSTFILPLPTGQNSGDVRFSVRAVDNEGQRDPSGATVVFPIVNSRPSVRFTATELPPDSTFGFFHIGFVASDPDGNSSVDRVEIALNDTTGAWITLDPAITLIVADVIADGSADLFVGRSLTPIADRLTTVVENGTNTFYVRSFDESGARSATIAHSWYVKRQTSRTLVIHDDPTASSAKLAKHISFLRAAGVATHDYMDARDGVAAAGFKVPMSAVFPKLTDPIAKRALAEWDHIYWISHDLDRNISYALDLMDRFLNQGGTLFIAIPGKPLPIGDPAYSILPATTFGSLPPAATSFRIANGSTVTAGAGLGLPNLTTSRIVNGRYPVVRIAGSTVLFSADYRGQGPFGSVPYNGEKTAIVESNDGRIVYSALDLVDELNDGTGNVTAAMTIILRDRLDFKHN